MAYFDKLFHNADNVAMVDKYITVDRLVALLQRVPEGAILRISDITRHIVIHEHEDADSEQIGWIDIGQERMTMMDDLEEDDDGNADIPHHS